MLVLVCVGLVASVVAANCVVPQNVSCLPCVLGHCQYDLLVATEGPCVLCCGVNASQAGCASCAAECACAELCNSPACRPPYMPTSISGLGACQEYQNEASCCSVGRVNHLELVYIPAKTSIFDICESCAANWEIVGCAAVCHPEQSSFISLDPEPVFYICQSLCELLWASCLEDNTFNDERLLRRVYANAAEFCQGPEASMGTMSLAAQDFATLVVSDGGNQSCMSRGHLPADAVVFDFCERLANPTVGNEALVVCGVLTLGGILSGLLHRCHFKYLPESGVLIALGVAVGCVVLIVMGDTASNYVSFNKRVFELLLLPPIIFECGYSLRQHKFFQNMDAIMLHALLGTFIAAMVFGGLFYGFSLVLTTDHPITFMECMAFGCLLSATDPVATLATFSALGVEKNLEITVAGEAVINDGIALILFHTFSAPLLAENPAPGQAVATFFILLFGSSLIGIGVGLVAALIFRFSDMPDDFFITETVVLIAVSWCAALAADTAGVSAIIAALACGLICEHYTWRNLSRASKDHSLKVYKQIATLADMTIFFLVGLVSVLNYEFFDPRVCFISLFLMLVSRMVSVFPLNFCLNKCRKVERRIPLVHSGVMWWAGLRGAVAVSMSLEFPSINRPVFVSTTLFLALVSVFIFGGLTPLVLKVLRIEQGLDPIAKVEKKHRTKDITQMTGWQKFDNLYVKPLFIRRQEFRRATQASRHSVENREDLEDKPHPDFKSPEAIPL